ncbi:MAG: hypothetical protein ACKVP3_18420 [Hyphomicrobiaceae bacterium]
MSETFRAPAELAAVVVGSYWSCMLALLVVIVWAAWTVFRWEQGR